MPYDVHSPVQDAGLERLDDRPETIQFSSALTDGDYEWLGAWLRDHPEKELRAYGGYDGSITDLDFLRFFPTLRRFQVDRLDNALTNIDGLAHLPEDALSLGIGRTRKRVSLAPLARFTHLERLYLEGQTKDIEVVAGLTTLRSVTLRSITLPDLSVLTPLHRLRALELKLGGTTDLTRLPDLEALEYVEIWRVRGLTDLSPLADLPRLEFLFLQALRQVQSLPRMSGSTGLRRLWLETMKGVNDLSPLRTAPALEQLALVDMGHLRPDAFACLAGHHLRAVRYGLGSDRKNAAVQRIIGPRSDGDWTKPVHGG